MSEKSLRPAADGSSEAEDGEEAAEVPQVARSAEEERAPVSEGMEKAAGAPESEEAIKEDEQKAAIADTPPEEEEKKSPAQTPPQPPRSSPSKPPDAPKPGTAASTSPTGGINTFANDGSFLELFKKKMESKEENKPEADKRKPISFVGKRRGGAKLALKTGMVAKKPKAEEEEVVSHKGGAWAQYMAEVKKYKAHQCSDDDKTRPLVK